MLRWIKGLALIAVLAACDQGGNITGGISGTVRLGVGASGADAPQAISQSTAAVAAPETQWVEGEVLVQFKTKAIEPLSVLQVQGVALRKVRDLAIEGWALYRANTDAQATVALVQGLLQRSDVQNAHPNYIFQKAAIPDDTFYNRHWHYEAINMQMAWDIEKGFSNPVTVAVIDTGVLGAHPDFAGKLLPGYDFISDRRVANDGDGRDSNPEDPGDEPGGQGSYHGSHVAGTVAAATNNGRGIAGMSWGAKILPVRVLGVGGGSLADIADAIVWSSGGNVPGVPNNPNPAQVINMSIQGRQPCSNLPIYQAAIDLALGRGSIIVASAGNFNEDAAIYSPGSCFGVINVGATGPDGRRAPYSNFGTRIDVMAPGGNLSQVVLGNPAGVLSLLFDDSSNQYVYGYYQGTSMAAPHVAGLIALMKSKKPSLNRAEALDILYRTSRPLDAGKCVGGTTADCGAGLIEANEALKALNAAGPSFNLTANPSSVKLNPGGSANVTISITRSGGFNSNVTLSLVGAPLGVSATFTPNPASTSANMTLNVGNNTPTGVYSIGVQGSGGGVTRQTSVSLIVGGASSPTISGTSVVALFWNGNDFDIGRSRELTLNASSTSSPYNFLLLDPGQYVVAGWKDTNNNGDIDSGDFFGAALIGGDLALITPPASGVNFTLELVVDNQAASALEQRARLGIVRYFMQR